MPRWLRLMLRLLRGRWLPNPPPPDDGGTDDGGSDQPGSLESAVNRYRAKHGLRPLKLSECLRTQAAEHSAWMAGIRNLSHTGFSTRLAMCNFSGGSENVASGYKTNADVIDGWDTSSGHRRNMQGDWTHVGGERSGTYWTLIFGR